MGYRLEISEFEFKSQETCGKLFGYVEDEKQLKSHGWLLSHGYIDGNEWWNYGFNPKIVLDAKEFKEFMMLYAEDWKEYKGYDLMDEELKALCENDNYKFLEWF